MWDRFKRRRLSHTINEAELVGRVAGDATTTEETGAERLHSADLRLRSARMVRPGAQDDRRIAVTPEPWWPRATIDWSFILAPTGTA
ncbi:hypothetical protein [Kribbella sp.]|uniref:hypothetical protein n=1 Tax=Kribbella sp. TaxID=1871183 RepID=UPI002D520754|nr:hypothetical protein [Kribbella sp.]HZX02831.1 hypothetical protein [Kribbella sp.]